MGARAEADTASRHDVVSLIEPLRRYALSRTGDQHDADDVVQETLARVLAARQDLEPSSLLAYAIVIARNLLTSHDRSAARTRRLASRVIDLRQPERPDETIVDREEQAALAAALAALPADLRETMVAHALHDVPVTSLASRAGTSPAAVAAQLARTRARLRVDYLLALRREDLPSARCRPVLMAMSLGDRRRQRALGVGSHLLTCRVCADLSEPLLERRRALAGVLPWLVPAGLLEWLRGIFSRPGVQAGSAFAGAAVGVATVALMVTEPWVDKDLPASVVTVPAASAPASAAGSSTGTAPGTGALPTTAGAEQSAAAAPSPGTAPSAAAAPATGATPTVVPSAAAEPGSTLPARVDICPTTPSGVALAAGASVRCERGLVLDVPADEGFWLQGGPGDRLWVQLTGAGESRVSVRRGQRVSFSGLVVDHASDYPARVGVRLTEGATDLSRQRAHVELPAKDLTIAVPAR